MLIFQWYLVLVRTPRNPSREWLFGFSQHIMFQYLTKQTASLRDMNESRMKTYEQLELSMIDLERGKNTRILLVNTAEIINSDWLLQVTLDSLRRVCWTKTRSRLCHQLWDSWSWGARNYKGILMILFWEEITMMILITLTMIEMWARRW